jgi:hypothetical protein
MHHVAPATFYASFERTVKAINTVFADAIRFPWGDTPALERMSREFYAANGGSLEGCVLAVDGIAIKIQKPSSLDTSNPNQFYCRKGFHALNVQAGCDARLRFRIASIEHVGSTHDSLAWSCTAAAKYMEDDSKLQFFHFHKNPSSSVISVTFSRENRFPQKRQKRPKIAKHTKHEPLPKRVFKIQAGEA